MENKYPSFKNLKSSESLERLNSLKKGFKDFYISEPEFCIKAPGRVNLIGEHIDYCGYAVFPMAVAQDILVVSSLRDDGMLWMRNTAPEFKEFNCDINNINIDGDKLHWYKYFLCGIMGIKDKIGQQVTLKGLSVLIKGTIPPSAGLSSSSALVCAAALTVAHANKISITSFDFSEICARSERYIGTLGGGMDQAAIFLSTAGYAQMIEFNPLRTSLARLPDGASFVIANSLVMKNKAASSDYNCRVVECRLSCRLLALKLCLDTKSVTLGEIQKLSKKSLPEMIDCVQKFLHKEAYSKEEIASLLGITIEVLDKELLSENTKHITEFHLYKRAMHVFSEANRVLEFKKICDECFKGEKSKAESIEALKKLGHLMDASHSSLKDLYECSHPLLDKMVEISRDFALGARLTGAGWGGCIVALVTEDKVEEYIAHLKKHYFKKEEHVQVSQIPEAIFSTVPSDGASIYLL